MEPSQYARLLALQHAALNALLAARSDADTRPVARTITHADADAFTAVNVAYNACADALAHTDTELALDRARNGNATMARQLRLPEADETAQAEEAVEGGRERLGVSEADEPEQP